MEVAVSFLKNKLGIEKTIEKINQIIYMLI